MRKLNFKLKDADRLLLHFVRWFFFSIQYFSILCCKVTPFSLIFGILPEAFAPLQFDSLEM